MKKLTLVVINWNGLNNLKVLIPSLRRQTFKNFDILVSDNGSTDGSIEWMKKNRIKFVANGRNLGFSGGANAAMRKVRTKYVGLFNDDMKFEPNCLELLMDTIEADGRIGAVMPLIVSWDGSYIESTGLTLTYGSFIATRDKYKPFVRTLSPPKEIFGANGGAAIYRTSVVRKLGFFDESFNPIYYEDADLSMRIKKSGFKNMLQPSAVLYHKSGHSAKKLSYRGRYSSHRNRYRFLHKHGTPGMWAKTVLWTPVVAGFYILRKPEPAFFHATFDFAQELIARPFKGK